MITSTVRPILRDARKNRTVARRENQVESWFDSVTFVCISNTSWSCEIACVVGADALDLPPTRRRRRADSCRRHPNDVHSPHVDPPSIFPSAVQSGCSISLLVYGTPTRPRPSFADFIGITMQKAPMTVETRLHGNNVESPATVIRNHIPQLYPTVDIAIVCPHLVGASSVTMGYDVASRCTQKKSRRTAFMISYAHLGPSRTKWRMWIGSVIAHSILFVD